jgi:uncharacterized protein (TIGR02594 family)
MKIRFLAAALLCALVASCASVPAFARGHHHHHRHQGEVRTVCDDLDIMRPCGTRRTARERVGPVRTPARTSAQPTHQWASVALAVPIGSNLVERARAYLGRTGPSLGLPSRLWCADFMNMVTGGGTGSRVAKSWLARPHVSAQIGAVVVTGRRGGGHVGIVSGFTARGDVIIISGNHGRRVGEGVYSRSRVIAFVSPG